MAAALQTFIQEIDSTIAQSSRERRGAMLRHLTDFYLVGSDQYSDDEIALIDDVYVRLIDTIEESARALLAMRIAPLAKAPPKILRILACDDAINVASPILMQSEPLDDESLIACARSKSQDHLFAISRRRMLAEALTDILLVRGDRHVVLSTASNAGAKISNKGFAILVNRSSGDDRLTLCVGTRPDVPPQIFRRLLDIASETVRLKLESESPYAKRDIRRIVDGVANEIWTRSNNQDSRFATAQALVNSLNTVGRLTDAKLRDFAETGRIEEVVAALSLMANMPIEFIEGTMDDRHTERLLILAKSIGLSWHTTQCIIRLVGGHHRHSAIVPEHSSAAFRRLRQPTACQILDFHRTNWRTKSNQTTA